MTCFDFDSFDGGTRNVEISKIRSEKKHWSEHNFDRWLRWKKETHENRMKTKIGVAQRIGNH